MNKCVLEYDEAEPNEMIFIKEETWSNGILDECTEGRGAGMPSHGACAVPDAEEELPPIARVELIPMEEDLVECELGSVAVDPLAADAASGGSVHVKGEAAQRPNRERQRSLDGGAALGGCKDGQERSAEGQRRLRRILVPVGRSRPLQRKQHSAHEHVRHNNGTATKLRGAVNLEDGSHGAEEAAPETPAEKQLGACAETEGPGGAHQGEESVGGEGSPGTLAAGLTAIHRGLGNAGATPFLCSVCSKSFSSRCVFERHLRVHSGQKVCQCDVCGKMFSDRSYLERHSRVHTGKKPFQCDICKKLFSDRSSLNVHSRVHTGEKPFECGICGKRFSRRQVLVVHCQGHTGDTPFQCEVCGRKFSTYSSCSRHSLVHTGGRRKTV